jgi:hypothetical protein
VLVDGSPSDSRRRTRTDLLRMACKRSGVRIPIAPLFGISAAQSLAVDRPQDRSDRLISNSRLFITAGQRHAGDLLHVLRMFVSRQAAPSLFLQVRAIPGGS